MLVLSGASRRISEFVTTTASSTSGIASRSAALNFAERQLRSHTSKGVSCMADVPDCEVGSYCDMQPKRVIESRVAVPRPQEAQLMQELSSC